MRYEVTAHLLIKCEKPMVHGKELRASEIVEGHELLLSFHCKKIQEGLMENPKNLTVVLVTATKEGKRKVLEVNLRFSDEEIMTTDYTYTFGGIEIDPMDASAY